MTRKRAPRPKPVTRRRVSPVERMTSAHTPQERARPPQPLTTDLQHAQAQQEALSQRNTALAQEVQDLHDRLAATLSDLSQSVVYGARTTRGGQPKRRHAAGPAENELLQAIVDQAADGITVRDITGRLLFANAAAQRFAQRPTAGTTLQEAPAIWGETFDPMGRPLPVEVWPISQALRGETVGGVEWHRRLPDGTRRVVLNSAAPLRDAMGTIFGAVSITTDITARKQGEDAVQSVARFPDENPDPILRVTREGTVLYANRTSAPLLRCWHCAVGQRLPAEWCAKVADSYARGAVMEVEVTCDEDRVFSCILTPIAKMAYVNIYSRDITGRKQAEKALRHAHATLEQRVQERTAELAQAVQTLEWQSSQIRSLASELTMAEQRERSHLAELIHDGLQQLLVAAKFRLDLLSRGAAPAIREGHAEVARLLDAAIADSRSLTSQLSPPILKTGGLLAGLTWLVRWSRETHHLTVHIQAPLHDMPELPEDLTVLLFQSVRELLFNVVKYAQVSEASIEVAQKSESLNITVADAGVGFDPTHLRAEGGITGGFGLARTRHRLELLGGCMDIVGAPGHGTRVTLAVRLPKAVPSAPAPEQIGEGVSVPTAAAPVPSEQRKIRVLLADDHQVVRQALAQMLRAEPDLEVIGEAADGKAGVERTKELAPDVVLMDISMPGMNGIEATQQIHAECSGVQVIGLSMFGAPEQTAAMQQAGAAGYVSKSAPAEELLAAIRTCAGRTSSQP